MKIELDATEIRRINEALTTQMAQVKRAYNTEKEHDIKDIRLVQYNGYEKLKMKLNSKELFDEKISK